jgi:hypothetical protein
MGMAFGLETGTVSAAVRAAHTLTTNRIVHIGTALLQTYVECGRTLTLVPAPLSRAHHTQDYEKAAALVSPPFRSYLKEMATVTEA